MKAIHKYRNLAKSGNKEARRRIAQSMGYRHTIYDDPKMIKLLHRAGIEIDGIDYRKGSTDFVGEEYKNITGEAVETTTLTL